MKQTYNEVLDLEKATCKSINNINQLEKLTDKMYGAKLEFAEPVIDGMGDKEIREINMYFNLANGKKIALVISPSDDGSKLLLDVYSAPAVKAKTRKIEQSDTIKRG